MCPLIIKFMNIKFTKHAQERMLERNVKEEEVIECILRGIQQEEKEGKVSYIKRFPYNNTFGGKFYQDKEVKVNSLYYYLK